MQQLRLEIKAIQDSFYSDYKVALDSIAIVLPYFAKGHFTGRVNGLQIWRRPLLVIQDGYVDVVYTKIRDNLPNGTHDYPGQLVTILQEHLAAYFEVIYDILDKADKANQDIWTNVDNLILNLTNEMERYSATAVMDENYIKWVVCIYIE